jgi:hypothetical protein
MPRIIPGGRGNAIGQICYTRITPQGFFSGYDWIKALCFPQMLRSMSPEMSEAHPTATRHNL